MKIFLDCLGNKPCMSVGTNAFIISDIQLLNRKFPNCEIVLFSSNSEIDKKQFNHLPYKITYISRSKKSIKAILQLRKIVKTVDVVVSAWGDGYITVPPYKLLRKSIFLKENNKPLMLLTSSIGPFNGGIKDKLAVIGLRRFDILTVRDKITYDYLEPYNFTDLRLVHDTAFVLEPCNDARVYEILSQSGLKDDRFIGLNVSVLLYNIFAQQGRDYIELIAKYILWLQDMTGLTVLLIPHQIYPEFVNYTQDEYCSRDGDDRYVIEKVIHKMGSDSGVCALTQEMTPQEFKGVIGKSEMLVGGRMHAIIAGISLSVPSLVMQYSHKSGGMMQLLGMEEYVWDIHDSYDDLVNKTEKLWKRRKSIQQNYQKLMPDIYQDIFNLTDDIEHLMSSV